MVLGWVHRIRHKTLPMVQRPCASAPALPHPLSYHLSDPEPRHLSPNHQPCQLPIKPVSNYKNRVDISLFSKLPQNFGVSDSLDQGYFGVIIVVCARPNSKRMYPSSRRDICYSVIGTVRWDQCLCCAFVSRVVGRRMTNNVKQQAESKALVLSRKKPHEHK